MLKAFVLSDLETFNFEIFRMEHEEKCDSSICISFMILGDKHFVNVECLGCGTLEDITDIRNINRRKK